MEHYKYFNTTLCTKAELHSIDTSIYPDFPKYILATYKNEYEPSKLEISKLSVSDFDNIQETHFVIREGMDTAVGI